MPTNDTFILLREAVAILTVPIMVVDIVASWYIERSEEP